MKEKTSLTNKNSKNIHKKIYLNHLNFTINFIDFKYFYDKNNKLNDCVALHSTTDNENEVCIFLRDIEKFDNPKHLQTNIGTVAHEIIHAMQHLCKIRHIDFSEETEHMAYLMGYIINLFLGNRPK